MKSRPPNFGNRWPASHPVPAREPTGSRETPEGWPLVAKASLAAKSAVLDEVIRHLWPTPMGGRPFFCRLTNLPPGSGTTSLPDPENLPDP